MLFRTALCALLLPSLASAFTPTSSILTRAASRPSPALQAVVEVGSEAEFDAAIADAADKLVVIDFATTWCGPCKVMLPKFVELSEANPNSVFLKVVGDSSPDASKLMKREGVRSVPSFHYWKDGAKVDQVNGANLEAVEGALNKHA